MPDPRYNEPLLPVLALPVLSTNKPLTPAVPAFRDRRITSPLLVEELKPPTKDSKPPLDDPDAPADMTTCPPLPLFPEPTVKYNEPPRPEAAVPEPKYMAPLLPLLALPVLSTRYPLTPESPPSAVLNSNDPLLREEP